MTRLQREQNRPAGTVHHTAGGLPDSCYSILPSDPTQIITLTRGVIGYTPNMQREDAATIVANLNEGLTRPQVLAMESGAMFGWDIPGADPAIYNADGTTKPQSEWPEQYRKPEPEPAPEKPTQHWLDAEDRDTILAALRLYQDHLDNRRPDLAGLDDIATNGGAHEAMDSDDIDELCERLN